MPETYPLSEQTTDWIRTEFASANLGDERLNKRLASIVHTFCSHPTASIPQASGTWANTKAAYRFLKNEKVTHENILQPHHHATHARIRNEKVILAVQDTTSLNYTHLHETTGLGSIGTNQQLRGMLVHTTMAFTPEKVPLGIIHQQTWIRPEKDYGKKHQRKHKPIDEKESQKWLLSLNATRNLQKQSPDTFLINVGDREADIYELFYDATHHEQPCHLLVRAA